MKSKSIVIRSHGGPEVIEVVEADVPDPGPGEVRIRQRAVGLELHRHLLPDRAVSEHVAARPRLRRRGRRRGSRRGRARD